MLYYWHASESDTVTLSHGAAVGSGMSLCVLSKTLAVCEDSIFMMPETIIGMPPIMLRNHNLALVLFASSQSP
jgi:enoyl-CoA hydratase/carnithine racemase